MSTVVSQVMASKMKPSASELSMVGSMEKTMLLTNCPAAAPPGSRLPLKIRSPDARDQRPREWACPAGDVKESPGHAAGPGKSTGSVSPQQVAREDAAASGPSLA
jgi:hypothetical protein